MTSSKVSNLSDYFLTNADFFHIRILKNYLYIPHDKHLTNKAEIQCQLVTMRDLGCLTSCGYISKRDTSQSFSPFLSLSHLICLTLSIYFHLVTFWHLLPRNFLCQTVASVPRPVNAVTENTHTHNRSTENTTCTARNRPWDAEEDGRVTERTGHLKSSNRIRLMGTFYPKAEDTLEYTVHSMCV